MPRLRYGIKYLGVSESDVIDDGRDHVGAGGPRIAFLEPPKAAQRGGTTFGIGPPGQHRAIG